MPLCSLLEFCKTAIRRVATRMARSSAAGRWGRRVREPLRLERLEDRLVRGRMSKPTSPRINPAWPSSTTPS